MRKASAEAWMIKMKKEWRKTSIHRDVRMYMWKDRGTQ